MSRETVFWLGLASGLITCFVCLLGMTLSLKAGHVPFLIAHAVMGGIATTQIQRLVRAREEHRRRRRQ